MFSIKDKNPYQDIEENNGPKLNLNKNGYEYISNDLIVKKKFTNLNYGLIHLKI